jgi:hypothetical protein
MQDHLSDELTHRIAALREVSRFSNGRPYTGRSSTGRAS